MTKAAIVDRRMLVFRLASSLIIAIGQMCRKLFQPKGFSTSGVIVWSTGFALYALGALVMIAAFRFGELSVLHPFLSSSYIFAIAIGCFVFHETLSCMKFFSIVLIGAGLILLGHAVKMRIEIILQSIIFLPLTAITYCWSMLLAKYLLGEKITLKKCFSVLLIFIGIIGLAIS